MEILPDRFIGINALKFSHNFHRDHFAFKEAGGKPSSSNRMVLRDTFKPIIHAAKDSNDKLFYGKHISHRGHLSMSFPLNCRWCAFYCELFSYASRNKRLPDMMNRQLTKLITVAGLGLSIATLSFAGSVKADTVQARCDVYPKGSDRAKSSGLCTFSQRQGFVGIQLPNGKRYDLSPVGDRPGNYKDQNGQAAYRQSGLGDKGQIYRLATESIYVYWDPAPYKPQASKPTTTAAKSPTPLTYMTPQGANVMMVQITEGEFRFRGPLRRTSGNMFAGEDSQVRVMYDKGTSRVVVINKVTGTEFYNYFFSTANEGKL